MRQMWVNFPEAHPLYVGNSPSGTLASITWPKNYDVVINIGNKMQHNGVNPIVARGVKFIDMRIDYNNMGKVMATDVPLVADVGLGLDDLLAALEPLVNDRIKLIAAERAVEVRKYTERSRAIRAGIINNPEWNNSPMIADRVTWEVAQFADPDAIIVHEAGSVAMHSFGFNPVGGRELFFYYGGHLGSGVGTAAGVKLARPNQQVICLVGDGSFLFGPHALWNMARLELPVITIVYNNHAYGGPHSRTIANAPSGRMVETGQYVGSYLGNPDMNMASIATGFGVRAEVVQNPTQFKAALARAKASSVEGRPYLIDVQVARRGIGWNDTPWIPPIKGSAMRTKKV
jgi:thiamine pyrophosphate-dependent acetolactate synthase large subunit-like protein